MGQSKQEIAIWWQPRCRSPGYESFVKVVIPSSPNSCTGSKNMFIQNEQKIEREVMKFGSKEGSLYPTRMYSSNSKVLPSWLRRFVDEEIPGP